MCMCRSLTLSIGHILCVNTSPCPSTNNGLSIGIRTWPSPSLSRRVRSRRFRRRRHNRIRIT